MKRTLRRRILLILFVLALVLKKAGIGLSIFLSFPVFILLSIEIFRSSLSRSVDRKFQTALYSFFVLFFFISIAQIQYWIEPYRSSRLIFAIWIIFSFLFFFKGKYGSMQVTLWIFISVLISTAALMNPREYHNFYRASYYEDYIRRYYTETLHGIADLKIDRYKSVQAEEAKESFDLAEKKSAEKNNSEALRLYNKSIDLNPDDAKAYHTRGYFKLSRFELNADLLYSAVKDFDRAILLDPAFSQAYFHRGLALSILGRKLRTCEDLTKAKALDPSLKVDDGLKKNCN